MSLGIITILATAAILTVLSSELPLLYAQTNQNLERNILDVHNAERAAVHVAPLTWDNSLADGAQTWANQVARTGQFKHDPVYTGYTCKGPCYGENIAGFFRDVSEPDGGQSKWIAEKSLYHGGPVTDANLYDVGHYTQMVWQKSTKVGCATAPPSVFAYSILVCRYDPPGNDPNQLPYPAPPSQAVGEEENAAPPLEQGAAPPGESGGGDNSGSGGGDNSGSGGGDNSGSGGGDNSGSG